MHTVSLKHVKNRIILPVDVQIFYKRWNLFCFFVIKAPSQAMRHPWGWVPLWTSRGSKGWTCSTNSCCWPNTTRPGGTPDTSHRWMGTHTHRLIAALMYRLYNVYIWTEFLVLPLCLCSRGCYSGPGCSLPWDTEGRTDPHCSPAPRRRHPHLHSHPYWTTLLSQRSR